MAEAFASRLQGVNSQESYDSAVQDLMQWAPQQAARLPKVWSREAMEPMYQRACGEGQGGAECASLKEQTDFRTQLFKERQAAAGVPKYTEDSTLNVAIDRRMQQAGIPRGTPPPEAILTQAQEDVETGKIRCQHRRAPGKLSKDQRANISASARHGSGGVIKAPGGNRCESRAKQSKRVRRLPIVSRRRIGWRQS